MIWVFGQCTSRGLAALPPSYLHAEILRAHDWTIELIVLLVLVGVAVAYVQGSAANGRIADAVGSRIDAALSAQFSAVGIRAGEEGSATTGQWKVLGPSEREIYASGRANAFGALVTLRLKPRQDVLGGLLASAVPSLGAAVSGGVAPPISDQVTIEVPLRGSGGGSPTAAAGGSESSTFSSDGFVLAVLRTRERKALLETAGDVRQYGTKELPGGKQGTPTAGLSTELEVITEHSEILQALREVRLGGTSLAGLLAEGTPTAKALVSLHITDAPSRGGFATAPMSRRALRVVVDVPREETAPAQATAGPSVVETWVTAACELADRLAAFRLPGSAKERVREARAREAEKEVAAARRKAEEDRRRAVEEKEAAARAERLKAIEALPRDQRRKAEIEERKKAMDAAMPKMRVKKM